MNDKEINSHLKRISLKNWNRLFDLIPQIQATTKFGEWHGGKPDSNGIIEFPNVIHSRIVNDFVNIMYELDLIVDFDWGNWEKGNEILRISNFADQDNVTLVKILTVIIRNGRFNEGLLIRAFENKSIEKILIQIKSNSNTPSLGIVNFDAHLDLRPYNIEGSSGTMFSQIADNCIAKEQEFAYMCLGVQTSANTISLFKKADSLGVNYIFAKDFDDDFENNSAKVDHFISAYEHIYVTICSDLFNSASAPGVSAMQPFGMNPEVVLRILKQILVSNKVISIDIAEVSPRFDQDKRTAKLAAVIIYAIINTLFEVIQ